MSASSPKTFQDLRLSPELIQTTADLGYTELTPIQAQSIPMLLEGRDLIAQAQTGSGKTAAFSIPILERIQLKRLALQAIVLCPTRELCTQVAGEIRKLGRKRMGLRVLIVSGGQPIGAQIGSLERGIHIMVGTPGRVLDHLRRGTLNLSQTRFAVLDEADRMLEMGFQEDVELILSKIPPDRQTLLFSATFPPTIEAMSRRYQKSPERVTIEASEQTLDAIEQEAFEVPLELKFRALCKILEMRKPPSAIIFCNLKANVIDVARELSHAGFSAAALHGDLDQWDRDQVMARFRNQSVRILVATDVAARGIDVPNLEAVINFDLPAQPEIYVHRIGRTGRAGQKGYAASISTSRESAKIGSIEALTQLSLPRKTLQLEAELKTAPEATKAKSASAAIETLRISAGRKDKLRPGDILGALTGEAGGLPSSDVGKIEIHDHHSFVAVSAHIARVALGRLRDGKIKGRRFRVDLVQ